MLKLRTKIEAISLVSLLVILSFSSAWAVTRNIQSNKETISGGTYFYSGSYDFINNSHFNLSNKITNSKGHVYNVSATNLQKAEWELNNTGGTVWLPNEIIKLTGNFNLVNNTIIQGTGDSSIIFADGGDILSTNKHNIKLSDFKIIGKYGIKFTSSINGTGNFTCENINAITNATSSTRHAFYFYVNNAVMNNIHLSHCNVLNSTSIGYMFDGTGTADKFNTVNIEYCVATNCGRYSGVDVWAVGFDLAEGVTYVENMTVSHCKAEGSWESGFHIEATPIKKQILITDCVSNFNGRKGSTATYGAGFVIGNGVKISNCYSSNNTKAGLSFIGSSNERASTIENCNDFVSGTGLKIIDSVAPLYIDGFISRNATNLGINILNSQKVYAKNLYVYYPKGDPSSTFCNYLGSSTYPLQNSTIEIYAFIGDQSTIVAMQGGRNNTIGGYIRTATENALYLWNCKDVVVKNMVIDASGTNGIKVRDCADTYIQDTIIKNSVFTNILDYGVYREIGGNVIIDKSTVFIKSDKITTPYSSFINYTENYGNTSVANNGTINHLCYTTPTMVQVTCFKVNLTAKVIGINATGFKVCLIDIHTGSPPGGSWPVYWEAKV